MSLASNVSLGALRLQAQQRADLENNFVISIPEWNQYISQSRKRLFDMLVGAYGNEYYIAPLFQFLLNQGQYYPLPDGTLTTLGGSSPAPALYKLIGVDLQYSSSPTGFVTLERFEEIDRNKYSYPNTTINQLGYTNLRYRISGNNIEFVPIPAGSQLVQLKYIQKPPSMQFMPTCATVSGSPVVTMSDVGDLLVGMSCFGSGIVTDPAATPPTILSINTIANTVTLSANATATQAYQTLYFWRDDVTVDGVSGWEEFIVIDSAIKARTKTEEDCSDLRIEKAEMKADIEALAEGRDAGQAHHVSDAMSISRGSGMGGFGDGWGGDGGY